MRNCRGKSHQARRLQTGNRNLLAQEFSLPKESKDGLGLLKKSGTPKEQGFANHCQRSPISKEKKKKGGRGKGKEIYRYCLAREKTFRITEQPSAKGRGEKPARTKEHYRPKRNQGS